MKKSKKTLYKMIRDSPYGELIYAIKKQAFVDLSEGRLSDDESFNQLYDFCNRFFVEVSGTNTVLLHKSAARGKIKMLEDIINNLERMEKEVKNMKMSLDKMYEDMINNYMPVNQPDNTPVDDIEEKMQTNTGTVTDTSTNTDTDTSTGAGTFNTEDNTTGGNENEDN